MYETLLETVPMLKTLEVGEWLCAWKWEKSKLLISVKVIYHHLLLHRYWTILQSCVVHNILSTQCIFIWLKFNKIRYQLWLYSVLTFNENNYIKMSHKIPLIRPSPTSVLKSKCQLVTRASLWMCFLIRPLWNWHSDWKMY